MIRAALILAALAGPVAADEAPKPVPPTEACSVCDLRQQSKRRAAAARQAAQAAERDQVIIALPPAPKGD